MTVMALAGHIQKQVPVKEMKIEDVSTGQFKDSLRVSLSSSRAGERVWNTKFLVWFKEEV